MKNTKLEFSNISEAREVLIAMKNASKAILRKSPSLYEDYNITIGKEKVTLQYIITEKSTILL